MSARIVLSTVAAEHGLGMADMLSARRDSRHARYTAALLMHRLLDLRQKEIGCEFGRRDSWGHHALKAARRMLAGDRLAQARFDRLEVLCRLALAGVEESVRRSNRQKEEAA